MSFRFWSERSGNMGRENILFETSSETGHGSGSTKSVIAGCRVSGTARATSGVIIMVVSLVGLVAYFYLLFMSPLAWFMIQLSVFLAVAHA